MDDIFSINIKTDSTFLMLLEAQKRGHEIFYYLPSDLNFESSKQNLFALVKKIFLKKTEKNYCQIIEEKQQDLTDFDVILIRQDPPFDMNYITSTYLLEKIKNQVLILNDPSEIRNCSEKIFASNFSSLTPPTLITRSLDEIKKFRDIYQKIILKPLYSCAGDGVVLVTKDDPNLASVFEMMIKTYSNPIIVQRFIPEITSGDKRIIMLDGEPIAGMARIAKQGEVRSNLHIGGVAKKIILSKRDLEICKTIAPELKKRGLFFVGIDVIGDYLTEINVTSPTGISAINQLYKISLEEQVLDGIEGKLKDFKASKSKFI